MRYMLMFKADQETEPDGPACKVLPAMGALIGELSRSGVLLATEGLQPSATGARVRLSEGKLSVMDGPFAEAKELVAGFALVEAGSKEAAVALAERFLRIAGAGACEVREVI